MINNINYFQATVGTKQRFYIVAQSPQESRTMSIFWQCVWEADVYLVVQLTEDMSYVPLSSQQRLEFGQVCKRSVHWVYLKALQFFIPVTHGEKEFILFGKEYVRTNIFKDSVKL